MEPTSPQTNFLYDPYQSAAGNGDPDCDPANGLHLYRCLHYNLTGEAACSAKCLRPFHGAKTRPKVCKTCKRHRSEELLCAVLESTDRVIPLLDSLEPYHPNAERLQDILANWLRNKVSQKVLPSVWNRYVALGSHAFRQQIYDRIEQEKRDTEEATRIYFQRRNEEREAYYAALDAQNARDFRTLFNQPSILNYDDRNLRDHFYQGPLSHRERQNSDNEGSQSSSVSPRTILNRTVVDYNDGGFFSAPPSPIDEAITRSESELEGINDGIDEVRQQLESLRGRIEQIDGDSSYSSSSSSSGADHSNNMSRALMSDESMVHNLVEEAFRAETSQEQEDSNTGISESARSGDAMDVEIDEENAPSPSDLVGDIIYPSVEAPTPRASEAAPTLRPRRFALVPSSTATAGVLAAAAQYRARMEADSVQPVSAMSPCTSEEFSALINDCCSAIDATLASIRRTRDQMVRDGLISRSVLMGHEEEDLAIRSSSRSESQTLFENARADLEEGEIEDLVSTRTTTRDTGGNGASRDGQAMWGDYVPLNTTTSESGNR